MELEKLMSMTLPELEHHGVKGMKWGVRKERDKASNKSAKTDAKLEKREAKAKKFDDKAAIARARRLELESKLASESSPFKRNYMQGSIEGYKKEEATFSKEAAKVRDGKLTTNQRNALILASALAVYGTYKLVDSGHAGQIVKSLSGNTDWKTNPDLAIKMDADGLFNNVVSRINPDYGLPGTTNNCRRCTFAYEMSRRGFDVDATKTLAGTGQTVFGEEAALGRKVKGGTIGGIIKVKMEKKAFEKDGTPMSDVTKKVLMGKGLGENTFWEKTGYNGELTSSDVFSRLMRQPEGSRGEISVRWMQGGAHSIAYEIVDKKPVIFDTQTNRIFKTASDFDVYMDRIKDAGFTRLDDKELDTEFLQRWLKSK